MARWWRQRSLRARLTLVTSAGLAVALAAAAVLLVNAERLSLHDVVFINMDERNALFDEALDVLPLHWAGEPFSYKGIHFAAWEVIARPRPVQLQAGDLSLDPGTRQVCRGETPIDLTPREFALLEYLMRRSGQVVPKAELLEHVWDPEAVADLNVVEVYAGYLRRKIDAPFGRNALQTVRGAGYRLAADGG